MVSRIPRVAVRPVARHVSVQVVEEARRAPSRELIIRVVGRLRHCVWQSGPRKGSAHTVSPPCVIVAIRQIAQRRLAQRVRQSRQLRRAIVAVARHNAIG